MAIFRVRIARFEEHEVEADSMVKAYDAAESLICENDPNCRILGVDWDRESK